MTTTTQVAEAPRRSMWPRWIILGLLVALSALLVLWSTGSLTPRPKLAIVTASTGPYWDQIIEGAQDAARRHDLRLTVVRASGDEQSQTEAIRKLIGQGYDGVAISPNDPQRQAAVLADIAAEASLVTFDSDSPISSRVCFIGTDNYDAGRMCGQQIRQALPDGGDVIIAIGSLDKENGKRRRQGVIDELLERSFEPQRPMDDVGAPIKGSKYTIVATLVDGIDPEKATALAAEAVQKYPNVKCFAGLFAYSTPALLKAMEQTGKLGQVKIVGFDANEETLAGIEQGTVESTVVQDATTIGYETVRILADAVRGDRQSLPLYPQFYLSCEAVNKSNIENIRQRLARRKGPTTKPA